MSSSYIQDLIIKLSLRPNMSLIVLRTPVPILISSTKHYLAWVPYFLGLTGTASRNQSRPRRCVRLIHHHLRRSHFGGNPVASIENYARADCLTSTEITHYSKLIRKLQLERISLAPCMIQSPAEGNLNIRERLFLWVSGMSGGNFYIVGSFLLHVPCGTYQVSRSSRSI